MKKAGDRWKGFEAFVNTANWIFAKTYTETWPHHYIVKNTRNGDAFEQSARQVRQSGYLGRFYNKKITYLELDGFVYWTMVPPNTEPGWYPVEEETIINRCPVRDSYEYRQKIGALPNPPGDRRLRE